MTPLTIEINDAVHRKAPDLPVCIGSGGLQPGINPTSNKSMLQAADDQKIDATKHLLVEATANLIHASESATLPSRAPLPSQEAPG